MAEPGPAAAGESPIRRASGGLAIAAAIVAFGFIGLRLLGIVRTIVIAGAFGTSPELDAYNIAFRIPDLIFQVLAGATLRLVRTSLLTISAMLALGYVSRYSGMDAILGLAFARTGVWYPFFGAMLGWLGVALTGSDTSSNVLFGSLQTLTAQQVGVDPTLMAAANSSGGVMGKMIDAQSIVVASTATRWYGQEGRILRFVFWHSLVLASLVGVLIMLQAYVYPFTRMVVR